MSHRSKFNGLLSQLLTEFKLTPVQHLSHCFWINLSAYSHHHIKQLVSRDQYVLVLLYNISHKFPVHVYFQVLYSIPYSSSLLSPTSSLVLISNSFLTCSIEVFGVLVDPGLKFVHFLSKTEQFSNLLLSILNDLTHVCETNLECSNTGIKSNHIMFFVTSLLLVHVTGIRR